MKPCSEGWSSAWGEQPSSNSSCPIPPHFLPKTLAALWLFGMQALGFRDAPETLKCCENQCVPAHLFQRDCSRGNRTATSWTATALCFQRQIAAPSTAEPCSHIHGNIHSSEKEQHMEALGSLLC